MVTLVLNTVSLITEKRGQVSCTGETMRALPQGGFCSHNNNNGKVPEAYPDYDRVYRGWFKQIKNIQ